MKEIPLTQGQVAFIDDEDFERVSQYKWCAVRTPKGEFYAVTLMSGTRSNTPLHRFITCAPADRKVDHRNHNGLDNQRHNLRICTQAFNGANTRKRQGTSSEYKGVSFDKSTDLWRSSISVLGKKAYLGSYSYPEDAARAYDREAFKRWGEYAYLNFPDEYNFPTRTPATTARAS